MRPRVHEGTDAERGSIVLTREPRGRPASTELREHGQAEHRERNQEQARFRDERELRVETGVREEHRQQHHDREWLELLAHLVG